MRQSIVTLAVCAAVLCGGTASCNTIIGSTTIWDWLNQLNAASFAAHSDWRIPTVGRDGAVGDDR